MVAIFRGQPLARLTRPTACTPQARQRWTSRLANLSSSSLALARGTSVASGAKQMYLSASTPQPLARRLPRKNGRIIVALVDARLSEPQAELVVPRMRKGIRVGVAEGECANNARRWCQLTRGSPRPRHRRWSSGGAPSLWRGIVVAACSSDRRAASGGPEAEWGRSPS